MKNGSRLRVLIVEDDAATRRLLAAIVARSVGAEVSAVDSVAAGLAQATSWIPHLVLTDYHLLDRDALELIRGIRTDPALRRVAVVLCSGESGIVDLNPVLVLGLEGFLRKPFQPGDVAAAVRSLLADLVAGRQPPRMGPAEFANASRWP